MAWFQDLTHAVRALARNPGFASIAILTLALGIGANTAIFSIIHGVLLSPLPYPEPDRIVAVSTFFPQTGRITPRLTGGDLVDIRADGQIFDALSYYIGGEMGVQLPGRAEFTGAYLVNPEFFRVFGARPIYGRLFENDDQGRAALDRAAVVSLPFAERNFRTGPAALGRTARIENRSYTIVGVLPAGFQFPAEGQIWVTAPVTPENLNRTAYNYRTVARLKPGVSLETAKAHLETIGARLASSWPDSNRNKSFVAIPLRDQLVGPVRTTLYLLMGAVALVLLIACTNVADLMLARATARSREIAVRAALGAGRWNIIRPLLAESAVLASAGGALGLLTAVIGTDLLVRLSADRVPLPRLNDIHVDGLVLIFATVVSLGSSLIFGLVPAWQATRVDLQDALKLGGGRGLVGGRSFGLRNGLVIAQIALSFVLAVGAGLLMRSFVALNNAQLGFRTDGILVMYAHAPAGTLDEQLGVGRLFERLFGELAGLPGVKSVAGAMGLPTGQYGSNGSYAVEGKHIFAPGQRLPHADFSLASPGYFATLGIPLLRGREFSSHDEYNANFVAIISAALAREIFPNEDPIGRRVQCGLDSPKWMTIVGVVGDVRQDSPASAPGPVLYMPLQQHPFYANELQVVVRTAIEPVSLIGAVREKVRALNPEIAMKFTTLDAMVADSIARPRFRMLLISGFAGLALLLVMAGVYGVMSYVTTQRTSEFGLRAAMGATPGDLIGLVLKNAVRLAAVGLAIGILLSLAAGRAMASMLFGIEPADALTYLAILGAVAPIILLAAAVPAWRAGRIDPVIALREE
jgi:putative ABC transport system permease protein